MVTIYITDASVLAPRYEALCGELTGGRRELVLRRGPTEGGLQSLAAGLLIRRVLGEASLAQLQHNPYGKPFLPGGREFNISHAGAYAVLATGDGPVGVDIERCREVDFLRLGGRCFHPNEMAFLRKATDPKAAFFTLWTLKESFLKAEGRGFSIPPSSVCILPVNDTEARMEGNGAYRFGLFNLLDGYALSACSRGEGFTQGLETVTF